MSSSFFPNPSKQAPPLIDAIAPKDRRSLWLGYFFMSIPIGFAIGNVFAGLWLNFHKVFFKCFILCSNVFCSFRAEFHLNGCWHAFPLPSPCPFLHFSASCSQVGSQSWRMFFFAEAVLMLPFFFITLLIRGPLTVHEKEWIEEHQVCRGWGWGWGSEWGW